MLEADGGTRCASITGGYVALALALRAAASPRASSSAAPLTGTIAAVSCGDRRRRRRCSTSTTPRTRRAEVDANVVMTGEGGLVEVQATAERTPLSRAHLDELLALAADGIEGLRARAGRRASRSDA